jgi:Flp pilus assembly protein TadD
MKAVGQSRVDEAISKFKVAIKLYPRYLRALNDLGVIYLKLNRLDEAAELFNQAIKIDKRFYYSRLNLGVVLNRQENFKGAAELLAGLYKENPSLQGLPVAYADALAGAGQLAKAEQVLRAALSDSKLDHSSEIELRFKLGLVLNREEHFAEAATELQKVVDLDPSAANAFFLLGASHLQLNRLTEAEKALLHAYELAGPAVGIAQMFLGQLYLMQQKPEAALAAFEQYLKDVPAASNSAQIKAEIEKLKAGLKKK